MGNEKGRKRLDSIKDIFREKGSQKWTFPFQFQFCHKVFQVHISESSAIMFQFNAYRPIKNQSQTFLKAVLGVLVGKLSKTCWDTMTSEEIIRPPLSSS